MSIQLGRVLTLIAVGGLFWWLGDTMGCFDQRSEPDTRHVTSTKHESEADARYGPWWRTVPDDKRPAVIKFCLGFLDLTAQEQIKVFYFNEDKTLEAWRACDWLEIHGHLKR